jgi:hypothetical protein
LKQTKSYKNIVSNIALMAAALIVLAFVLEIILRLLPVNQGLLTLPVNDANPVLRFKPNREATWSRGAGFSIVNTVRTNNYGFINDRDYDPDSDLPLIAVIGDSYIEAAMVPFPQTGHGRLATALESRARVYSFAGSGTALSGYLAYAAYARDVFRPERMIILVVGNDFDESFCRYKDAPGYHCFVPSPDGSWILKRNDYQPSFLRSLSRRSRLALYLLVNCRLYETVTSLKDALTGNQNATYVGNTLAEASDERLTDSRQAVDLFLIRLPEAAGLDPGDILLCLDGIRPALYEPGGLEAVRGTYYDAMRRYFMERAREKGYPLLDLQPVFVDDYRHHQKRFEFLHDGHWNERGHRIFYQAVFDSGFVDDFN